LAVGVVIPPAPARKPPTTLPARPPHTVRRLLALPEVELPTLQPELALQGLTRDADAKSSSRHRPSPWRWPTPDRSSSCRVRRGAAERDRCPSPPGRPRSGAAELDSQGPAAERSNGARLALLAVQSGRATPSGCEPLLRAPLDRATPRDPARCAPPGRWEGEEQRRSAVCGRFPPSPTVWSSRPPTPSTTRDLPRPLGPWQ
jgi:hypothetical protein